ncbi:MULTISPECIES: SCO family protein [Streptomyces]|uniref:SCO family protein n=1 Tax=Streptomyces TaxID=1883 RepID=UPI000A3C5794|nr:SCO family protein [Streptomyces murinus]MYR01840.1 SCO family protein [Streptomyces sp. SID6139]MYR23028.1 SCO family protein [Streptomyces sp. SID6137]
MRKKTFAAAALLAAATLTLSACGGQKTDSSVVSAVSQESGGSGPVTVLDQPWDKPGLVLTDTHGKKYDLRKETQGHPTLLYFGYTHCPDICPTTMSNIAVAAQKSLTPAQRADLRVVFVTTDPGRDTPAALGSWLKGIDPRFIGLTGDFKTIQAAARSVGISVEPTTKNKAGQLVSMHGTQVVAFSPKNDGGYAFFDDQATVDDYIKDLPKIVQGAKP